jgi:hypothetical protein
MRRSPPPEPPESREELARAFARFRHSPRSYCFPQSLRDRTCRSHPAPAAPVWPRPPAGVDRTGTGVGDAWGGRRQCSGAAPAEKVLDAPATKVNRIGAVGHAADVRHGLPLLAFEGAHDRMVRGSMPGYGDRRHRVVSGWSQSVPRQTLLAANGSCTLVRTAMDCVSGPVRMTHLKARELAVQATYVATVPTAALHTASRGAVGFPFRSGSSKEVSECRR